MRRAARAACLLWAVLGLGCAGREDVTQPPASLSGLQALRQSRGEPVGTDESRRMREQALRESAATLGARHGFVLRMREMRNALESQADVLEQGFNYGAVMRMSGEGEVAAFLLPASVRAVGAQVDVQAGGRSVQMADQTYEMLRPSVMLGGPPSWRDFLLPELQERLEVPDDALLPGNARERRQWRKWVQEGWWAGVAQADREMRDRVRALRLDYVGVVRYLRLVREGKMTAIVADSSTIPVAGGEDARMVIRQTMHRLVQDARFNTEMEQWRQLPLDARGSLR